MATPIVFENIIKLFLILVMSNFIYIKITNCLYSNLKIKIICVAKSMVLSIVYALFCNRVEVNICLVGVVILDFIFLMFCIKSVKEYSIVAYLFSVLISYVFYLVALIVAGFIIAIVDKSKVFNDIICLTLISIVDVLIFMVFTTLKRVKNGFNFLQKITMDTTYIIIAFCVLALSLFGVMPKSDSNIMRRILLSLGLIVSVLLFLVIKKLITKHYKNNMRDRAIAIQKEEIDANVKVIEELKQQNLKLSTTIHKYNHRLSALESSIKKVMDRSNTEFASELSIVLEQTKTVATQFADETKVKVELPSTNVVAIDNMLEYMRNEAIKCNIDFTLKLNDSIKPLLEKYVPEDKFETLLADHIKDAIIAINAKNEGYKSIMVLIGAVQGAYELSIYDTGIEFDIPTLLKLGKESVTTHKDNGGSGLGFMTTFETLKCSKASLVIEEYDTSVTNYTKSVTIRFDSKSEYRIYSYRAEEINKACSGRKIIIKKI